MKSKFGIKNFRTFNEKGIEVEIAPITILTGCNGSGKSSITKGFVLFNDALSSLKLKEDLFKGFGVFDQYFSSIGQTYFPNAKLSKIDFSKPVLSTLGNIDMLQYNSSNNDIELSMETFSYVLNSNVKVVLHIGSLENDFARNGHVLSIDLFNAEDNTLIGHLDKDTAKWSVKSIDNDFVRQFESVIQHDPESIDSLKGMKNKIYGLLVQYVFPHLNDLSESINLFAKYNQSRIIYSSSLLDDIGDCRPDSFSNHIEELFRNKEIDFDSRYIEYINQDFLKSGYNQFIDYYKHIYSSWISSTRTVQEYTLSYDSNNTLIDLLSTGVNSNNIECCSLRYFTMLSRMYSNGNEIVDLIPMLFKEFMSLLVEEITTAVGLDYVSSARATIKRAYPRDINDEFTKLISEYFDARFSASQKKNTPDVYKNPFIDHWLNEFKIGKAFHTTNSEDGSSFIIKIMKNDGTERLLADEGYGVTQFISILLQIETEALKYKKFKAKYSDDPSQTTIVVEEPEIHLHPRYQSLLADMFLDAYKKYHIHFIIETHSEYLIRRFQTLVADKELGPEDISIAYLTDEEHELAGEPKVKQIGIKEDGFLSDSFGSGFFDEGARWSKELIDKKFA